MNNFFDISKTKEKVLQTKMSESFESKYLLSHYEKIRRLDKDLNRLPSKEEFFFLQSDTSFNAFTFIPFVLKHTSILHLYACTYSISSRVIDALIEMHDNGLIDEITLLISDSMIKRNPKTIDNLCSVSNSRPNVNILFAWVHAKVCLMETKSDHFIIEGSGNWAENAYYEQYTFANSKGLFDFRKELFTNSHVRHIAEGGAIKAV
ncbi:hypothetical protein JJL45_05205 [Tamlana sp. s12]|uniref:hypothetical protein n=1 Tax=Tamlana sp. s12 TaxID=1630406 RepID=UPI0007FF260A|nr:hypothetical protein [Tamlana sp. s12]OBQ56098.1 hypothetical protein VQ01_06855 [Tamlana sp. s12]QQY83389.1 hypothetical protein JJL45_05205 [Tamlana sp. s12]